MNDSYTEVTTTSWGSRIINSLKGIILGLILFIVSFIVLWTNEERSVNRIKTLDQGRNLVTEVPSEEVNMSNNNALIHISGTATTDEILEDTHFGVMANALKLKRVVKMYQWDEQEDSETTTNTGGSQTTKKTYTYRKKWLEGMKDSSQFKNQEGHENPTFMPYQSEYFEASNVTLDAFTLTSPFKNQIQEYKDYPLSNEDWMIMDEELKNSFVLNGPEYYYGDPGAPIIGDLRITFEIVRPLDVSVIGKQSDRQITTYFTKNGEISLLDTGIHNADAMFQTAEDENALMTWFLRVLGFVLMWFGLSLLLRPLSVVGDVVPFIGSIIGAGIGLVTGVIALVLSLITIAIAWVVFRPLIGGAIVVLAIFFGAGGFSMLKNKAATVVPAAQPVPATTGAEPNMSPPAPLSEQNQEVKDYTKDV